MGPDARRLLIELLVAWDDWDSKRLWYLSEFIPNVVAGGPSVGRNTDERIALMSLRVALDRDEWDLLGRLVVAVEKRDGAGIAQARAKRRQAKEKRDRQRRSRESIERRRQEIAEAQARQNEMQRKARAETDERRRAKAEEQARKDAKERELAGARDAVLAKLEREFEHRFIDARRWLAGNDPDRLIDDALFRKSAAEYVRTWCQQNLRRSTSEAFVPDLEQATAIATLGDHALVAARAGSGKTATMVARSIFMIKSCRIDPSSILMLAFNAAAADEIRERLAHFLPPEEMPHVMTFHALAHRIVDPPENLLRDESDSMRALSRHVQDVVDSHLQDRQKQAAVRDVMLAYFKKDWGRIARRGDDIGGPEQVEFRRNLQDESIKGDFVKSYGEKVIANLLFSNGIAGDGQPGEQFYGYEHDVQWNGRNYKPDFSVYGEDRSRRIVIEYFGVTGQPDYDAQADAKRTFWSGRDEIFLEYFSADIARPGFEERFLQDLQNAGAALRSLSDEEIWVRIRKRALDRFTEAVTTLIGRARQQRWDGNDLTRRWSTVGIEDPDLDRFISAGAQILDDYETSLRETNKEDFSGLMWRAVDAVRGGRTEFGRKGIIDGHLDELRHIVVDEFQDFSLMFYELLQAMLVTSPECRVMAVGDDWQAINEFAGSSTAYFSAFDDGFPGAIHLSLTTNRRSAPQLVALGNRLMAERGTPARDSRPAGGAIRELKADEFEPSPIEAAIFGEYDRRTAALLRIIQSHAHEARPVAVLSRKRKGRWKVSVNGDERTFTQFGTYGEYLRELLQIEDPTAVQFSSTHGFKGQEAEAVILLDVTERNYPLIHPTWVLFQVFGDSAQSLVGAERRLFYVGVSRPHTHLDVVTTTRDPSEFWTAVRASNMVETAWDSLPEVRLGPHDSLIEIRVFNSGARNFEESYRQLQRDRFRFRGSPSNYWWRVLEAGSFDAEAILRTPWAEHPGIRVEAWQDGRCVLTHKLPVTNGSPQVENE